jgi:hypothetical protein
VRLKFAIVLAGQTMASCTPPSSLPQEVQASKPSDIHKHRNDEELVQANQRDCVL